MRYPLFQHPTRNHVRAVFETSAAVFELPLEVTVGDLARRLADLGRQHDEDLLSVYVRVGERRARRDSEACLNRFRETMLS